jgi:Mrp family chromosome partitioning ATPase
MSNEPIQNAQHVDLRELNMRRLSQRMRPKQYDITGSLGLLNSAFTSSKMFRADFPIQEVNVNSYSGEPELTPVLDRDPALNQNLGKTTKIVNRSAAAIAKESERWEQIANQWMNSFPQTASLEELLLLDEPSGEEILVSDLPADAARSQSLGYADVLPNQTDLDGEQELSDKVLTPLRQEWRIDDMQELPANAHLGFITSSSSRSDLVADIEASAGSALTPAALRQQMHLHPVWSTQGFTWPAITTKLIAKCSASFELLIREAMSTSDKRMILISGISPSEGRSTSAICIARVAAQLKCRTLLVDANLNSPMIARLARLDVAFGWQELLADSHQGVEDYLIASRQQLLTVLPVQSPLPAYVTQREAYDQLVCWLEALQRHFDLIVIDGPTIGQLSAIYDPGFIPFSKVVMVQNVNQSSEHELQSARRVLQLLGTTSLAVIQNRHHNVLR